ncbi:Protein CBG27960 [Caenorhabditis briggsae]|uniref:Protein CBG27960 n=1 Tax=Caenorhabditis briggsae TaxID=6238 RepID=B6IJQ2_CAEBR|nr:Protein CBG27960 [Caenorhabditis briggsae]CAS00132.1 Protein CBG27960 [Caenorhabditis briggsae]
MPCIIATFADFGELEKNNTQNLPGFIQYKSTVHTLDKKDFDRIRGLTAIRLQSQYGLPLEIEREFRVRIWVNGEAPKFYHIYGLKICNIENMVVRFFWKPSPNNKGEEDVGQKTENNETWEKLGSLLGTIISLMTNSGELLQKFNNVI